MNRIRAVWLLSIPLSAAGMLLAHHLAWEHHSHEAATANHGYLRYGAILAALGGAALVVGAIAQFSRAVGGGSVARAPSARVFAVVPIVGFVLQEHLEHLTGNPELAITFLHSTPFLLGLALQVPFALAAMLIARLILGFVQAIAAAVSQPGLGVPELLCVVIPVGTDLPLRPALALRHAGRAPPTAR